MNNLLKIRCPFGPVAGVAIIMLSLTACGGGGQDGKTQTDSVAAGFTANIAGVVSKGIVKGATVQARELNDSGQVVAQLGSASTGDNGAYHITIGGNYSGGPIELTLTVDGSAQMKCDVPAGCGKRDVNDGITDSNNPEVIDFGEWYKPGAFSMNALVPEALSGDSISANITPFTHLAAGRAKSKSNLTALIVDQANTEVSNVVGQLNILAIVPVDITDSAVVQTASSDQRVYAALAASIAVQAATDTDGHPQMGDALAALSAAYTGDKIVIDDQNDRSKISLKEIDVGTGQVLAKVNVEDASGVTQKIKTHIANNTTPPPDEGQTPLAKVKAFIADVRTWGHVIQEQTSSAATAFATEVQMAATAAQGSVNVMMNPAFMAAARAINRRHSGTMTETDLTRYGLGFTSGTLTDDGMGVYTIENAVTGEGVQVALRVKLPINGVFETTMRVGILSADFVAPATEAHITDGVVTLELNSPYAVDIAVLRANPKNAPRIDIKSATLGFRGSLTQRKDTNGNDLATAIDFSGSWEAALVHPVTLFGGDFTWLTPSHVSERGEIRSGSGHRVTGIYSFTVRNADAYAPTYAVEIGARTPNLARWWYDDLNGDGSADKFTWQTVAQSIVMEPFVEPGTNAPAVRIAHSWTSGWSSYTYTTYTSAPFREFVASPYSPLVGFQNSPPYVWVASEGTYKIDLTGANFAVDGAADGVMYDPVISWESPNRWMQVEASYNFELQLSNLPLATVGLSLNRTGYRAGDAEFNISYGNRRIVVAYQHDNGVNATRLTISNQDNVSVVVTPNDNFTSGEVKYNGQTYATLESMPVGLTKITYSDGTFESW